jgi:hypothetical protein
MLGTQPTKTFMHLQMLKQIHQSPSHKHTKLPFNEQFL